MYQIGDRILYPMHGAGTIEPIEPRKILGPVRNYYVLNISCDGMELLLPVDGCDDIGVRPIVSKEAMKQVISILGQESSRMSANWSKRQRENMKKLKTGDIKEAAEIVRNLTRMDRRKKLSAGEKKMLSNARRILLSEIMLVENMDGEEAFRLVECAI